MTARRRWSRVVGPLVVVLILLLVWEFVVSNDDNLQALNRTVERLTGWNPGLEGLPATILPRPSLILRQLLVVPRNGKGGPDYFWRHTRATLFAALLGFALGNLSAILTATAFLYVKPLERALMPLALALRSVPLVAITPLLLRIRFTIADLPAVQSSPLLNAIFGTDFAIKMLIVVIICYFPTLVNAARGLASVEQPALELMYTLRAGRWQTYWKLRVPTALPIIFAALRVTSSSAVLAAVVAEWLSASQGLGYIIKRSFADKSVSRMWMAMVISSAIAIAAFGAVTWLQRWIIPWYRSVVHLRSAVEGQG